MFALRVWAWASTLIVADGKDRRCHSRHDRPSLLVLNGRTALELRYGQDESQRTNHDAPDLPRRGRRRGRQHRLGFGHQIGHAKHLRSAS